MTIENKIKVGLALGSGGVKGLVYIGVIKELEKNKIRIDFISGTSIGALIGWNQFFDVKKSQQIIKSGAIQTNKFLFQIK